MILVPAALVRVKLMVLIVCLGTLQSCDWIGSKDLDHVSKILVVSDSMGTGYNIATPYPDLIRDETGIPVINDSVNGRESAEVLADFENLLMAHSPSHTIIMLGTNDARKSHVEEAKHNLQLMLGMAQERGINAIIATVPVYLYDEQVNIRTRQISDWILNQDMGHVVDIRKALGDGSETLGDRIHPNQSGQQLITSSMLEILAKAGNH